MRNFHDDDAWQPLHKEIILESRESRRITWVEEQLPVDSALKKSGASREIPFLVKRPILYTCNTRVLNRRELVGIKIKASNFLEMVGSRRITSGRARLNSPVS